MKKLILAVVILGGVAFVTSCKKDYVCSCSGEIFGVPFSGADTTFVDMSKKDAQAECDKGDGSFGSDYVECELK